MELLDCQESRSSNGYRQSSSFLLSPKRDCRSALRFCLSFSASPNFHRPFFFFWMLFRQLFVGRCPFNAGILYDRSRWAHDLFQHRPFSFYRNVPKNSVRFFIRDVFVKFSHHIPIMVQHPRRTGILFI